MSYEELKGRAHGRWDLIVQALASSPEMDDAIDRGHLKPGFCPVHGGKHGDAFRIFKDFADTGGAICNTCGGFQNGFALLAWLNGWDYKESVKQVGKYLDGDAVSPVVARPPRPAPAPPPVTYRPPVARLRQLWEEAYPATDPRAGLMVQYLEGRGIALGERFPAVLKLHPGLPFFEDQKKIGVFPCMLAVFTDPAGKVVALHRTYLDKNGGKAKVSKPKKMLVAKDCDMRGGAIRLGQPGTILGLSEGIENALAVTVCTDMPVWAAYSSTLLPHVVIPKGVQTVVIWADRDAKGAGYHAAGELKERLIKEGYEVKVQFPNLPLNGRKGVDWNDVLLEKGVKAFPFRRMK